MTRYPSKGKGSKWTVNELRSIGREWKGDILSDGDGLFGEVRVNPDGEVSISFRYCFKWLGKVSWFYCGLFPHSELSAIRANRDEARKLLKAGIDPRDKKRTDKIENREAQQAILERENKRLAEALTVKDMIDVWIADGVRRAENNKALKQSFNKHIIPNIGGLEVRKLTEHHLVKLYRSIVAAGKYTTAYELSKDVKQMFKWCEARQPWRKLMSDGNPAELVEIDKILPEDFTKIRDRILTEDEIKKLKVAFDSTAQKYAAADSKYGTERPLKKEVQIAMWLCLSTLCRIGELLMTEWKDVDFERRTWFIPAKNVKKSGKKKKATDHLVYLSDFALNQFRELHKLTGDTPWAFPARYKDGHVCVKSASKQIGDRQVKFKKRTGKLKYRVENDSLVLGEEEWTPHDLRTTGATMMQNLLGGPIGLLVSDLCLHHSVVTGSARHYLFGNHEKDVREGWRVLGERLENILSDTEPTHLHSI